MNVALPFKIPMNPAKAIELEKPKTNSGEPPDKVQPLPGSGDYCFRATVKTVQDNNEINEFHGYSSDMTLIVQETEQACERRRRNNQKCSGPAVMFIRDSPNCSGLITVTDKKTQNVQIIQYQHSKK